MKKQTTTLAGGCFWGMEDILRALPGVLDTTVGYTGGESQNPTYTTVKTGTTNHAESIQIDFDADTVSYKEILGLFFKMHDPTTENRQGNDVGTQYRSVIFYHDDEQLKMAQEMIKAINASKVWPLPIVTQLIPSSKFYPAEDYHQDYLKKNPAGYTCHWVRN